MLKFWDVIISKPFMDLVPLWYDDIYNTVPILLFDLKVKVMEFLGSHYFDRFW